MKASKIEKIILDKNYSVIMVDLWDTLLHRKCLPDDVKKLWSVKMSSWVKEKITAEELYQIRITSEQELYKQCQEITYDGLMRFLYDSVRIYTKHSLGNRAEFISQAKEFELAVEKKFTYPDQSNVELLNRLHRKCKIVIVSDFYLTCKEVKELLQFHGIAEFISEYFISSDWGCRKSRGDLYQSAIKKLSVSEKNCCMLGDNKVSDIRMAEKSGIYAFYRPYKDKNIGIKKDFIKNLKHLETRAYQSKVPFCNYSFILYYFIEKLYIELKKDKVQDIYFFSREGELLRSLFEIYISLKKDSSIKTHYLYVSRQSTFLAGMSPLEKEDFHILTKQFRDMTYGQFFRILQIDNMEIGRFCKSFQIEEEQEITDFKDLKCKLLHHAEFAELYERNRMKQRELFLSYLAQEKGEEEDSGQICVVDIGWKGTIQDNIARIVNGTKSIYGYYMGICEAGECIAGSYKKGIVFCRLPKESYNYSDWAEYVWLYERILCASHGGVQGYAHAEGRIVPVLKEAAIEKENYNKMVSTQREIKNIFPRIFDCMEQTGESAAQNPDLFWYFRLRSLYHVSKYDIRMRYYLESNYYENLSGKEFNRKKYGLSERVKTMLQVIKTKPGELHNVILLQILNPAFKRLGFFSGSAWCYRMAGWIKLRKGRR